MRLRTHLRSISVTRIAAMLFAVFALLMMSGCWMFSLLPLYDGAADPDLIFDESLVGSWAFTTDGCQWTLSVTATARAYDMTILPGTGCKSDEKIERYLAYLVKVDNHHFLDISPKQNDVCNLCLPLHTFALVSLEDRTLSVTPLDGDWLSEAIRDKKLVVSHVGSYGGEVDITLNAPPAELKNLLRTYSSDNTAFKPNTRLVFTRK